MNKRRMIVGISGASGSVYGASLVEYLAGLESIEVHLVISPSAKIIMEDEIGSGACDKVIGMSDRCYEIDDLAVPIASGSYITDGMVIAPCSAKTLSSIAQAYGSNLISRAADVMLKERRRLVIMFRETPLHLGHIENMGRITRMGGIVMPPVPAFYHKPGSIKDIVDHSVGKALDLLRVEHALFKRWGGM